MLLTDWNNAKARMLPFEGLASQIHILDVPKLKLNHVLRTIACETSDAKVSVLAGEILDKSIELSIFCKELDQCSRVADNQTTINSRMFNESNVTFDFWGNMEDDLFELEVWFWADQLFTENDEKNYNVFCSLASFLKRLTVTGDYQCILTPNEASDPLKDLESGIGVLIDISSA